MTTQAPIKPPAKKTKIVNFRLTHPEYQALQELAWSSDSHVATYITQTIRAAIREHQAKAS